MGETSGRAIGKVFGRGAKMTQGVGQRQGDGAKSNFFWQGGMKKPPIPRKATQSGGAGAARGRWGCVLGGGAPKGVEPSVTGFKKRNR